MTIQEIQKFEGKYFQFVRFGETTVAKLEKVVIDGTPQEKYLSLYGNFFEFIRIGNYMSFTTRGKIGVSAFYAKKLWKKGRQITETQFNNTLKAWADEMLQM